MLRTQSTHAPHPVRASDWVRRLSGGACLSDCRPRNVWLVLFLTLLLPLVTNCTQQPANTTAMQPLPDINQVLERHQSELMSISNVVGVYVGLLPDDKTPCLRVMLAREDPAAKKRIPARLEGYPVLPEVTGPIRPLGETNR